MGASVWCALILSCVGLEAADHRLVLTKLPSLHSAPTITIGLSEGAFGGIAKRTNRNSTCRGKEDAREYIRQRH
jgi:hypothetical protein